MKIVADDEIAAVAELFAQCGELQLLPGREISRAHLKDADALLIRSVTRVDAELLKDTPVRFVGTATSGINHIDVDYLNANNIRFSDTKGSNAETVADYCMAALAFLMRSGEQTQDKQQTQQHTQHNLNLEHTTIGIVGAGCVGSALYQRLHDLGLKPLVCDPPLEESKESNKNYTYTSLDELMRCDVVSLHVPLTTTGKHPTLNLIDKHKLALLGDKAVLLNTCRGGVVNETHLKAALTARPGLRCVLDVWCNEPDVDPALVAQATLATPHLAGYSIQAKHNAAKQLLAALQSTPIACDKDIQQPPLSCSDLTTLSEQFKASVAAGRAVADFDRFRREMLTRQPIDDNPEAPAPARQ
ncbi:MAG: 4-phosphoerythronate dehydrogenase [Pseudohongiellaceae bacterium]